MVLQLQGGLGPKDAITQAGLVIKVKVPVKDEADDEGQEAAGGLSADGIADVQVGDALGEDDI